MQTLRFPQKPLVKKEMTTDSHSRGKGSMAKCKEQLGYM